MGGELGVTVLGLNDLLAQVTYLRTAETPAASTVHHPLGRPGGPGLWHTGKQLPAYIQNVARAFRRKGVPESQAIERAVGVVRDWASGRAPNGGKVHPDVQAAAAKAIAEWEALKAGTGGGKRFNQFHAPAGPGGGEFTSGGGGKGAQAKAASSAPAASGHGHGKARAARKHQLLQRAAADRQKARQLEAEVKVLEQQLHAHQQAAAAAKKTKAAVAKGKHRAPVHHHHGHRHARKTQTLRHRISVLRDEISKLRSQADHLSAQAKAL